MVKRWPLITKAIGKDYRKMSAKELGPQIVKNIHQRHSYGSLRLQENNW